MGPLGIALATILPLAAISLIAFGIHYVWKKYKNYRTEQRNEALEIARSGNDLTKEQRELLQGEGLNLTEEQRQILEENRKKREERDRSGMFSSVDDDKFHPSKPAKESQKVNWPRDNENPFGISLKNDSNDELDSSDEEIEKLLKSAGMIKISDSGISGDLAVEDLERSKSPSSITSSPEAAFVFPGSQTERSTSSPRLE
jgi:hypothetical protein